MHDTVITLLPVLVTALDDLERSDVLDTVLKHPSAGSLHSSLCQNFGHLGCSLFRCLSSSLDVGKFPPTFQEFSCTLCDSGDKSKNINGVFSLNILSMFSIRL